MLKLEGNAAALMSAVKGGLPDVGETLTERLKCAISVIAGVSQPRNISLAAVLGLLAELHDRLNAAGLLSRPAQSLADVMLHFELMALMARTEEDSPCETLLTALASNITNMRVRTNDGVQLVEWESALPSDFYEQAKAVYRNSVPIPKLAAAA